MSHLLEIWLWDFGGQADQRLIHQLYMEETALTVLVFDGQLDFRACRHVQLAGLELVVAYRQFRFEISGMRGSGNEAQQGKQATRSQHHAPRIQYNE